MPKKFKVLLLSKHNVKYMRFLPFERILLLAWSAMSFRHARQPMVPARSCINRVLQGDASSGLEILFQNLRLLLTLWILHKWRTEKGQWTLMTVVSCSWFFAELHVLSRVSISNPPITWRWKQWDSCSPPAGSQRGRPGEKKKREVLGKSEMSYVSTPRKKSRGNALNVAAKRKSWTSLDVSFKLSTFYLASTVFYLRD